MKSMDINTIGRIATFKHAMLVAAVIGTLFLAGAKDGTAQEWQFISGEYNGAAYGDGGEIVVVGESGIILRSTDDGANWELPKSGTYYTLRDVEHLGEGSYVAVGDSGTILRSDDGGVTWRNVPNGIDTRLVEVAGGGRIYLLGEGKRLFRSDDGGTVWREMPALPEETKGFALATGEIGVIAGHKGGVYRTSDGGESWTEVYRDTTFSFLDADFASGGGFGLVSGAGSVILRTIDTGRTWERDSLLFPLDGLLVEVETDGRAIVAGLGAQLPVMATMGRSLDSGRTWEPVSFPFPQSIRGCRTRAVALGEGGRAIAGMNFGCIYHTEDDWRTALPVTQLEHKGETSKVSLSGPSFGTGTVGIIPSSPGRRRTTDGGITWLRSTGGTYGAVSFFSKSGAFMVLEDRLVPMSRTTDGGRSWNGWSVESDGGLGYIRQMRFLDSLHGFQVGATDLLTDKAKGFFYRTTDGARTFTGREFDHPTILHLADFVSPDTGWIGGGNPAFDPDSVGMGYDYGTVFRTTDGGETWRAVYDRYGIYATPLLLRFRNAGHGVICVGGTDYGYPDDAVLLETTDGGEAWNVKARFPLREAPADLVFLNDTLWYAVGGQASIWETTDAGTTWRREEIDPLPQDQFGNVPFFTDILLLPDERTVIASGRSVLVRRVFPQKVTGVKEEDRRTSTEGTLTLTPNPAANRVRILWNASEDLFGRRGELRIHDAQGRLIRSMEIDPKEKALDVDVSSLASGAYRVAVRDGNGLLMGTAPLVVIR